MTKKPVSGAASEQSPLTFFRKNERLSARKPIPPPIRSLTPTLRLSSEWQKDDSPEKTGHPMPGASGDDGKQPPAEVAAASGVLGKSSEVEVVAVSGLESPLDDGYSDTSSSLGTRGAECSNLLPSSLEESTGSSPQLSSLEQSTSSSLGSTDLEQTETQQEQKPNLKTNTKRVRLGVVTVEGDLTSDGEDPSPSAFPPSKRFHVDHSCEVSTSGDDEAAESSTTEVKGQSTGLTMEIRRVVIREDDNTYLSDRATPDLRPMLTEDSGSFRISNVNLKSSSGSSIATSEGKLLTQVFSLCVVDESGPSDL